MLDWLNVKAWLSAAVLILIVTTGAWIEREQDHFEEKQLEAYLDSFVGIVDKAVLVHGSLFIEINFTDDAKAGSGITIPSRFKNQLYEIILTERNAVFLQGSLRFSREFEQDVLLIGPESNSLKSSMIYRNADIDENELIREPVLRFDSSSSVSLFKLRIESNGLIVPGIIITQTN